MVQSARDDYTNQDGGMATQGMTIAITRVTRAGTKRSRLKARVGRGRRGQTWVEALHIELREEFDRLRKVGVKFNQTTLRHLALDTFKNSLRRNVQLEHARSSFTGALYT